MNKILTFLALIGSISVAQAQTCAEPATFWASANGAKSCLCPFTDKCLGSGCKMLQVPVRDTIGNAAYHPAEGYAPDCQDCKCTPVVCPSGTTQGDYGECICGSEDQENRFQTACSGSACWHRLFTRRQRINGQQIISRKYEDFFFSSCTDCSCLACPEGTNKDEDGDCQCPADEYCEGSSQCRESIASYGGTRSRSHHLHYFNPTCSACTCNGDALLAFGVRRNTRPGVETYLIASKQQTIASECAELCLDEPQCEGFTSVNGQGRCKLYKKIPDDLLQENRRFPEDFYDRTYPHNACDLDNGGCGNSTQIACNMVTGVVTCTEIDQCKFNNGGCPSDLFCHDDIPGENPVCKTEPATAAVLTTTAYKSKATANGETAPFTTDKYGKILVTTLESGSDDSKKKGFPLPIVIALVVCSILLITAALVFFARRRKPSEQPVGFENPIYRDGKTTEKLNDHASSVATSGYQDVPAASETTGYQDVNPASSGDYIDVAENTEGPYTSPELVVPGTTGYMDVSPVADTSA
eukprot:m.89465 g.89465  ORF g.89465 m.89465 type:complete len:526 (-) comp13223_c0_seq1:177-1754(-)